MGDNIAIINDEVILNFEIFKNIFSMEESNFFVEFNLSYKI